jgi:Zn-dependent M28 family amino/carboxypeptidase
VFNGANDNASGTAALFALAAYFRQHPPANPIIFAAFDGEEAGLLGSRAFVKAPPVDRSALALNVNADMLGRDPSQVLFVAGATRQPFLTPYIARVAAKAPVKLVMGHDDGRQGADDWTADSDQYAFLEADIPALYVGVDDAAQHHRPTDDYETIMYRFYVGAVEAVLELVQEFDQHLDEIR